MKEERRSVNGDNGTKKNDKGRKKILKNEEAEEWMTKLIGGQREVQEETEEEVNGADSGERNWKSEGEESAARVMSGTVDLWALSYERRLVRWIAKTAQVWHFKIL